MNSVTTGPNCQVHYIIPFHILELLSLFFLLMNSSLSVTPLNRSICAEGDLKRTTYGSRKKERNINSLNKMNHNIMRDMRSTFLEWLWSSAHNEGCVKFLWPLATNINWRVSARVWVGGVGWGRGWMFRRQISGIVGPYEACSPQDGSLTAVSFSPLLVSSFPSDRRRFFRSSCGETYWGSSKRRGECCFIYFLKFPCEKNYLLDRHAIP